MSYRLDVHEAGEILSLRAYGRVTAYEVLGLVDGGLHLKGPRRGQYRLVVDGEGQLSICLAGKRERWVTAEVDDVELVEQILDPTFDRATLARLVACDGVELVGWMIDQLVVISMAAARGKSVSARATAIANALNLWRSAEGLAR